MLGFPGNLAARRLFRALTVLVGTMATATAGDIRLNQIQVIGSHNSYHIAPPSEVMALLGAKGAGVARGIDYTHKPLDEQFSRLGIRQIELDVYADPKGGLYADPIVRKTLATLGKNTGPDPDPKGLLKKPGMKVLHVPDFDYFTTVPTLVDGFRQVRKWSKANPYHLPIFILIELKGDAPPTLTQPIPFDQELVNSIDAEILSVFDRGDILVPDDVRGDFKSLPEAIKAKGWPTLDAVRGRVFFGLDNEDHTRDLYLKGHENLQGRLMFTTVDENHPAAAWFKINDPLRDFDRIRSLVSQGFLVRTRADANTVNARANDTRQRDQALASGAQFVSTDYAEPDRRFSEYRVGFPRDASARLNPVSGPPGEPGLELEIKKSP